MAKFGPMIDEVSDLSGLVDVGRLMRSTGDDPDMMALIWHCGQLASRERSRASNCRDVGTVGSDVGRCVEASLCRHAVCGNVAVPPAGPINLVALSGTRAVWASRSCVDVPAEAYEALAGLAGMSSMLMAGLASLPVDDAHP
ncbi:MAG: hypothetical protein R2706_01315 [Acidimicrobiales bacterium]